MRIVWHILGRFYEARAERARQRMETFRCTAEKYFARIGGRK
jgi:hypothetical protein